MEPSAPQVGTLGFEAGGLGWNLDSRLKVQSLGFKAETLGFGAGALGSRLEP